MEYIKLKHIAKYPTGKLNSNAAEENGIYPFFTCSHDIYRINTYAYDGEYVLLGGNNATGDFPIFYYNGKFNAYQRTYLIQPKDPKQYDTRYLFYSIGLKLSLMQNNAAGTATRFLTQPILDNINIEHRSLPTQQKIASNLSCYDNLIQNYKKQIEALQTAASELYKEWFVRFRFPGYQTAKFENGIPVGWEHYTISELCIINGKSISTKNGDKEILYLDTSSITQNDITNVELFKIKDAPGRARRIVKNNSIIFSTVRPALCHYGIMKNITENLIVSTGFAVFDTKYDIANILFMFLSSQAVIDYCQLVAEGAVATYPTITAEEIGKISICLPSIKIAEQWNNQLGNIFLRINNLQQQITNLTQQRDLLLPRLMSGKLEVI